MSSEIAIIGMAGRFPDAKNLQQFFENLKNGVESVRAISPGRIRSTTLPAMANYGVAGYLEDIDLFDYALFNISLGEARTMDPHQRLLLEVVYETFENAGYPIDMIKGTNTAVFAADAELDYYRHADEFVPTLSTGNTKAFMASRINRQFDLKGGSMTVDTTCSSSLVALHLACNELLQGDASMAIVCAAHLSLFPVKSTIGLGLDSPDGKSRAFSAKANGMSVGEAAACLLLKPYQQAVKDGDIIHAVIKSSAINCNAEGSASLTAPDSTAQGEVIKKAWRKAGVDPLSIGFIESHGSGTLLGDSIEIGGLDLAFREFSSRTKICPISTVKSNIGHTRSAAGITGLIKTILSLKHKVLFPTLHFEEPCPLINFDKSSVYVNTRFRDWVPKPGIPRTAGISSIGLSGTNCHVVVEEAPRNVSISSPLADSPMMITVSSNAIEGLERNLASLLDDCRKNTHYKLGDIAYTLGVRRQHYSIRKAFLVKDVDELKNSIYELLSAGVHEQTPTKKIEKLIFIFSDSVEIPAQLIVSLMENNDVFRAHYRRCISSDAKPSSALTSFAFQYSCYHALASLGLSTNRVIGVGLGKLVVQVITGELTIEQGIAKASTYQRENIADIETRTDALIKKECGEMPVAFVELIPSGLLENILLKKTRNISGAHVLSIAHEPNNDHALMELIRSLYEVGFTPDFSKVFSAACYSRVELRGYHFAPTRCWIRETPKPGLLDDRTQLFGASELPIVKEEDASELSIMVAQIWSTVLDQKQFSLDDDFFSIGGDSLKCTSVINRLNHDFNTELDFEDLFDHPTLRSLTTLVNSCWTTESKIISFWRDALKNDAIKTDDNFFELGGHSLIANHIINRIRRGFNIDINFDMFFKHPTVCEQCMLVEELRREPTGQKLVHKIQPSEIRDYYPLSHGQKRIWITCQLENGSLAYNEQGVYTLTGTVLVPVLDQALECLIEKHEILRTTFHVNQGEVVQKIGTQAVRTEYADLRGDGDINKTLAHHIQMESLQAFDLEKGPLMRIKLFQTSDREFVCILSLHHIITDGWSLGVLMSDLSVAYNALKDGSKNPLSTIPVQYKDYAVWQNDQLSHPDWSADKAYWLNSLNGKLPVLRLETDYVRPARKTYNGNYKTFYLEKSLLDGLNELSQRHDATLFFTLLSSYYTLLHYYTGECDIIIGTPVAGRDSIELENQIGFYVNTLPLRTIFQRENTFLELLENVKDVCLGAYRHGGYPFDLIVEDIDFQKDPGRSVVFDASIVLHNTQFRATESNLSGIEIKDYPLNSPISKFDLSFKFTEEPDRLTLGVEYNTDLFSHDRIDNMGRQFKKLIRLLLDEEQIQLRNINLEPKSEIVFNDTVESLLKKKFSGKLEASSPAK